MAPPDPSADEIRREMRRIRCHMVREVDELAGDARELTSWRYYVRKHPWSIFSGLVALGFALVPRRPPKVQPFDSESLRKFAEEHGLRKAPQAAASKGLVGSLVGLAGTYAVRAGLNMASKQFGKWLETRSGASRQSSPGQGPRSREASNS